MQEHEHPPSPIRGRACRRCDLKGLVSRLPARDGRSIILAETDINRVCPDCKGSGFAGVTPEQVRAAELMAHYPALYVEGAPS